MQFTVKFNGPFAVSTGAASVGVDAAVDRAHLLPATAVKGVMRAAAQHLLQLPSTIVEQVFGGRGTTSPWSWSTPEFRDHEVVRRARLAIDPATRTAAEGHLLLSEEVWADQATFEIRQSGYVDDVSRHELVLAAAATSVHSLGRDRRRGHGWVTVSADHPLSNEDIQAIYDLRASHA